MEDEDHYIERSRLREWMEQRAAGRKILRGLGWLNDLWHLHLDRYRLWDERGYRVVTWVVALMLALLLAVGGRYGWRFYRHHEELRAEAEAQAYLAKGDSRDASLSAERAISFNPNNLGACRVLAAIAEQTHSPTALDWLGRVASCEPTVENKLRLAMAGLRYQSAPYPFTANILAGLAATASNNADYQVAEASLAMALHRLGDAETHYAAATALDPSNQLSMVSVALLELVSSNREEQARARELLEKVRTNQSIGLFALRGLVADRVAHRDFPTARTFSGELVSRPEAGMADQLQNLEILRELNSTDFPVRLQAVEQSALSNQTVVAEVSGWMRQHGLAEESLRWMMTFPNSMLDQPLIQINRAQGYLQTSNWTRLQEVASVGDWGDLEYLRFALVSHACSALGAAEMADSNWQAAIKEASSHLADMIQLLNLAESWGLKHEQEQLLLAMVKDFPDQRWVQKLVNLYFDAGNTLGLHQLYGTLVEYYPTNTACQNDMAATEMLLKINLEEAFDLSQEAYAKDPTNPTVAATFAYALHLQDRDLQGIDVLKKFPPEKLADPSVALYYGIALAGAGKPAEARPWLEIAEAKGRFLPEERQLLATALSQVDAATNAPANPSPP